VRGSTTPTNLAPTISGSPARSVNASASYNFRPTASESGSGSAFRR
jgi:hypothetical protein